MSLGMYEVVGLLWGLGDVICVVMFWGGGGGVGGGGGWGCKQAAHLRGEKALCIRLNCDSGSIDCNAEFVEFFVEF